MRRGTLCADTGCLKCPDAKNNVQGRTVSLRLATHSAAALPEKFIREGI